MPKTLHLLHYNNYYNRQVKRLTTIEEYDNYLIGDIITGIQNFNPNDGLVSEQIINWPYDANPDYLIVVEEADLSFTRWFIIDAIRTRNGQYKLTIKRDTIADYYEETITAPCLIEKGILNDNDPFIYNSEGQEYNKIKKKETLLKDKTGVPWIVGYIPKDAFPDGATITTEFPDTSVDIEIDDIRNYKYYNISNLNPNQIFYKSLPNYSYGIPAYQEESYNRSTYYQFIFNLGGGVTPREVIPTEYGWYNYNRVGAGAYKTDVKLSNPYNLRYAYNIAKTFTMDDMANLFSVSEYKIMASLLDTRLGITNNFSVVDLKNQDGKIIKDTTSGNMYRIKVKYVNTLNYFLLENEDYLSQIYNMVSEKISNFASFSLTGNTINKLYIYATYDTYEIVLENLNSEINIHLPGPSERTHLIDAPYDMFCIPYADDFEMDADEGVYSNKFAGLCAAIAISSELGSSNIYDLQILPYCPVQGYIQDDGSFSSSFGYYTDITDIDENIVSRIFWCSYSNFSFRLDNDEYKIVVENKKESNELDMYRLCSPNYVGTFEFSAAKNNGVDYYDVDCTYKPFAPYIHIAPNFKELYGGDFDDKRGLILGGDYSLPQLTSAWAEYELANKNYQNSFNREIETLEMRKRWGLAEDIVGSMTNAATTGLGVGGTTGNVWAGIGAAAGSQILGGIDVYKNNLFRKDEIDKAKTLFNYNLQNIQALPYNLSKSSALVYNDKYFPVLEYYSCTETEREAFRNKIKYNGMTVMRVGTVSEFIRQKETSYIQGQLIRIESLEDKYTTAKDIANELSRGIYI